MDSYGDEANVANAASQTVFLHETADRQYGAPWPELY